MCIFYIFWLFIGFYLSEEPSDLSSTSSKWPWFWTTAGSCHLQPSLNHRNVTATVLYWRQRSSVAPWRCLSRERERKVVLVALMGDSAGNMAVLQSQACFKATTSTTITLILKGEARGFCSLVYLCWWNVSSGSPCLCPWQWWKTCSVRGQPSESRNHMFRLHCSAMC